MFLQSDWPPAQLAELIIEACFALTDDDIRELIARWSKAVRDKNLTGIRADHDENILMFDVPPLFQSRGLDTDMATWDTFFAGTATPVVFDFDDVKMTAGGMWLLQRQSADASISSETVTKPTSSFA